MEVPTNGHGTTADLDKLEEFVHSVDSVDKAFKSQASTDALRLLAMLQDGGLSASSLLLDMPSSKFILGVAMAYQGCKEHSYEEGMEFLALLCGLLASKRGKRSSMIVDAIVGERRWKEGSQGEGLLKKAQNWILNKQ